MVNNCKDLIIKNLNPKVIKMSINSMRERLFKAAEKRRFPRVSDRPFFVIIDGENYRVRDWSLGGFSLRSYPRPVKVGDTISGDLKATEGLGPQGNFSAEVTWVRSDGTMGMSFTALNGLTYEEDILTLEDEVPVDPREVVNG